MMDTTTMMYGVGIYAGMYYGLGMSNTNSMMAAGAYTAYKMMY